MIYSAIYRASISKPSTSGIILFVKYGQRFTERGCNYPQPRFPVKGNIRGRHNYDFIMLSFFTAAKFLTGIWKVYIQYWNNVRFHSARSIHFYFFSSSTIKSIGRKFKISNQEGEKKTKKEKKILTFYSLQYCPEQSTMVS